MGTMSSSMKVGMVVVIAIIMVWGAFSLFSNYMQGEKITIYAIYDNADMITDGLPVKFHGRQIGLVAGDPEGVRSTDPESGVTKDQSKVTLVLLKDDAAGIYSDFVCVTTSEGLLGGKYLVIKEREAAAVSKLPEMAATSQHEPVHPVQGGESLVGIPQTSIDELLRGATKIMDELVEAKFASVLVDLSNSLTETLTSTNNLLGSITGIVDENEGHIAASMANLQGISENFLALSRDMREMTSATKDTLNDPVYRRQLENILQNSDTVSANLASITSEIDSLVGDEEMQADLKESVSLTRQTMEEARATLQSFQGTMENVDLLIDDSRGLVQGMDGLVEGASGLMEGAGGALDKISGLTGSIESRATFAVRAIDNNSDNHLNNDDTYVGDMNLAVGDGSKYINVGADRVGEENEFNFLFGYGSLEGFSLQGGVYRSELGLGASYGFSGGGRAEVMAYDTEDPKVNASAHVPVMDAINVVLGVEDAENDAKATVGVEIEL